MTIQSLRSKNEYPAEIYFDCLEELELILKPGFNGRWLEFIRTQVNHDIDKLAITADILMQDQFIAIADLLPNLGSMYVESAIQYTADDIVEFIDRSKDLLYLRIKFPIEESEEKVLRTKHRKKWHYKMFSDGDKIHMILEK